MKHLLILLALSLTIAGCVMPAPETFEDTAGGEDALCYGCLLRGVCVASSAEHCGTLGVNCEACTPGDCEVGYCLDGACAMLTAPDGQACRGSRGVCTAGKCSVPCAHEECVPSDPECASAYCANGVCAFHYFDDESLCGFAGHCDGAGHCAGLIEPLTCSEPCADVGECSTGSCDPYTGTCKQHHSGNGTSCNGGAGHCNSYDGQCCDGVQYAVCDDTTDPVACFAACANDASLCSLKCDAACPIGTVLVQGFCFPQ